MDDSTVFFLAIYGAVLSSIMAVIKIYEIRNSKQKDDQEKIIEKSKKINSELIIPLSRKTEEVIDKFNKSSFLKQESSDNLSFTIFVQHYDEIIKNSKIIKLDGDKYLLIYREDKLLCKHFDSFASNLTEYKKNLKIISSIVNEIKELPIPKSMELFLTPLCTSINRSINDLNHNRKDENFRRIITSFVLNNPKIFTGGRTVLIELLAQKNLEIFAFLNQDEQILRLRDKMQISQEKIIKSSEILKNELDNLTIEWQNEYKI